MLTFLRKLRRDDRGISALEYALLAGTILVVVGGVMSQGNIKSSLEGIFGDVDTQLKAADANYTAGGGDEGGEGGN